MSRAGGAPRADETAEVEAAKRRVAHVLELRLKAVEAFKLSRHVRAAELLKRAIAKAEELFPPDSLMVSSLMALPETVFLDREDDIAVSFRADVADPRLAIPLRRCRAGTLLQPTLEERAFFALAEPTTPLLLACANQLLNSQSMLRYLGSDRFGLMPEVLRRFVDTMLEMEALGLLPPQQPSEGASGTTTATWIVMRVLLNNILQALRAAHLLDVPGGPLPCGLNAEQFAVLRDIKQRIPEIPIDVNSTIGAVFALEQIRDSLAAADVARHGLRRCARPGCGATEPHPKAFKVCSRCRGAAYCAPSCQAQDWARHKRGDGCKKQADA